MITALRFLNVLLFMVVSVPLLVIMTLATVLMPLWERYYEWTFDF